MRTGPSVDASLYIFPLRFALMTPSPASLDIALIGNCAISALVDRDGAMVWCCMPRFDGDPIFHALLDGGGRSPRDAVLAVELDGYTRSEQAYDAGTAVLRTRLFDANGEGIEIVDFCPRFMNRDRTFRPAQIVRRIRPLVGHPRVRLVVRPRGEWGAAAPEITRGSNHLRFVPAGVLRLNTNAPLTYLLDSTWFSLQVPISLMLGPDETLPGGIEETAREFEEQTALYWRRWTRRLALPLEWQDAVIRSAITLKLCQFEETGAIVAAMTTSIPEAPGTGRNWDYRYCWLRDAFFVVRALNSLSEVARWRTTCAGSTTSCAAPAAGTCSRSTASASRRRSPSGRARPARLSGDGAGSRRQPGVRARPARRLRQHRARGGPGLLRQAPVSPAPTCAISPSWRAWANRPGATTTRPMPECGNCVRAPACTPPRR